MGRPKGSLKKYKFEETKLGFALKYECPAVFEVLLRMNKGKRSFAPKVELLELIFRHSTDPSLQKPKFARYLDEYRKTGLYCHRAKQITPDRAEYYQKIRAKKYQKMLPLP